MAKRPLPIDPAELVPMFAGLLVGGAILVLLIVLGLSIGLNPSIDFGIPHQ